MSPLSVSLSLCDPISGFGFWRTFLKGLQAVDLFAEIQSNQLDRYVSESGPVTPNPLHPPARLSLSLPTAWMRSVELSFAAEWDERKTDECIHERCCLRTDALLKCEGIVGRLYEGKCVSHTSAGETKGR